MKELIAHLTWYERAVVEGVRRVRETGAFVKPLIGLSGLSLDERNARIAELSRARSLDDVLAEAQDVFGQLVALIAATPDDFLNNRQLAGLPDDLPPWVRVANNAYAHHRQHESTVFARPERTERAGPPDHAVG